MRTRADDRSYLQRSAEGSLEPHPYRLELRGAPGELRWPMICANCGASASEQIVVRKALRRRRSSRYSTSQLIDFKIVAAPVPFCATCANEHRATVLSPTIGSISGTFFPYVIPVVGAGYFAQLTFREAIGTDITKPSGQGAWGLFGLMIAIILWCVGLWWRMSKPSRIDPQSDVTLACDFSADVSEVFERERHIYRMRNKTFADAFGSLNTEHQWSADDQARSRRLRSIFAVVILLALVALAGAISILR